MTDNYNSENLPQEKNEALIEVVQMNFREWNEALKKKDPEVMADFYANDATFLPTMSGDFKIGQEGAEEYFVHFLESDPDGEIVDEKIQQIGDNHYLHSGMYNFEVGPADDRKVVEARFTFVWAKDDDGEWVIIHHHSSEKPKEEKINRM